MFVKVFWSCEGKSVEVYAIRKEPTYISGFLYPIKVEGNKFLPHWTYHADEKRKPKVHHRGWNNKIINFMTLQESYVQSFKSFSGVFWSIDSLGAPFDLLANTSNVSGHPDETGRKIVFNIEKEYVSWNHKLDILILEKDKPLLIEDCCNKIDLGCDVLGHELLNDNYQPDILLVFSRVNPQKLEALRNETQ